MRNQELQEVVMEFGTIEREIYVDAAPEIVVEVVSSPDHVQQWWPDEASYEPLLGYITLEQARLVVDMVGHRLVHLPHVDLKSVA